MECSGACKCGMRMWAEVGRACAAWGMWHASVACARGQRWGEHVQHGACCMRVWHASVACARGQRWGEHVQHGACGMRVWHASVACACELAGVGASLCTTGFGRACAEVRIRARACTMVAVGVWSEHMHHSRGFEHACAEARIGASLHNGGCGSAVA
eukprot:355049-Chlamydomonas_euryale.AAC.3